MAFFEELSANGGVGTGQITEELFRGGIVLEEIESLSLTSLNCETLDVVEDEAGKIGVGDGKLGLSLFSLKLKLIHSVLEDFNSSSNIVLEHESAPKKIVSFKRVAADSLTKVVHLRDHFVKIGLHTTFVHLLKITTRQSPQL